MSIFEIILSVVACIYASALIVAVVTLEDTRACGLKKDINEVATMIVVIPILAVCVVVYAIFATLLRPFKKKVVIHDQ